MGESCEKCLLCFFFCPMMIQGTVYIRSGSEIGDCNMKCPQDEGVLELYTKCGGVAGTLLELYCEDLHTKNNDRTRLHLHTGSGCWKLTHAGRRDSCVYIIEFHSNPTRQLSSTEIRVVDPVLISNITSTRGRLGEEMAVSVQFSGEESAVTWEVDGEPLPERYRLIDDNRTLIIPGVQRDDAERRFRVRITNPVSEEIREYRLEVRETDPLNGRSRVPIPVAVICVGVMTCLVYQCYRKKESQDHQSPEIPEHEPLGVTVVDNHHGKPIQNGSKATRENGFQSSKENGSVLDKENGSHSV